MVESKSMHIHNTSDGLCYLTFPKIDALKIADCVFSTRLGGVSSGDFYSMNMSFTRGDDKKNVLENYKRLCEPVGINPKRLVFTKQTHTTNVYNADLNYMGSKAPENADYTDIDGLITNERGVGLVSQFADCVPLVFCDPVKKVIATSHAGWRGTVGEIGKKTVQKMQADYGCNPSDIVVGIGPSVGVCCYEVDEPVMEKVRLLSYIDENEVSYSKGGGKYMLDLKKLNELILINSNVNPDNIDIADICTACNSDTFFSHRVCGSKRGNLCLIIALK